MLAPTPVLWNGTGMTLLPATHREIALAVIGRALARPDMTLCPVRVTLPMHHWLADHGMAPGIVDDAPAWTVWDEDLALRTVGACRLPARGR